MELHTDQNVPVQPCDGVELLDLLFDKNEGILRHEDTMHRSDQPWVVQDPNMMMISAQIGEDFFNALFHGTDSVSRSPLWPPSPSDSGISEDPHSDQNDSPAPQQPAPAPAPASVPDAALPVDFNGWGSGIFPERPAGIWREFEEPLPQPATFPLTIKDLLLSGTSEPDVGSKCISSLQPAPASQPSCQELVLNEDEKKLLLKEGVTLPSQFPLTKLEERVLKKIRRKIRNKQSAQESRKKKKDYVDGLESRMATCSSENQELQRKVFQLEKCNISLMEQLRRVQAMVMSGSNKTAQTGTCVLVLLLSFTLILLPSLKPFTETKVSQPGDFGPLRVQSRSLHDLQSSRVLDGLEHPYSEPEESKPLTGFPGRETMEEITSLMEKFHRGPRLAGYDLESHNATLDQHDDHHHGDPITGHIATVTLGPRRGARLQPHADDI